MNIKAFSRFLTSLFLVFAFLSNALPCGPGYITPLFDTTSAPEVPYTDFAGGRLGIIKPGYRRSVLFAAYRYIAGNGLTASEQQAVIDVWKADLENKDFRDDSVQDAVEAWVARRKDVVGTEEKTPEIYVERTYGGYDFFPNCTKNAFETAAEALAERVAAHGPNDEGVKNWVAAQDQVFTNCSSGKTTPEEPPAGSPDWLQKDRAYQLAAASFYSLDYNDAKRRFAEIAQDIESPWAETADYLVARTLIRQASLSKDESRVKGLYEEAEQHLQRFTSRTGKFTASAERLSGLVRYRLHPQERVSELAKQLAFYGGGENFRQELIDYDWLLDKFANEILSAEEKRKKEEAESKLPPCNAALPANTPCRSANAGNPERPPLSEANKPVRQERKNENDLELTLYTNDTAYTFYVKPDVTDDEAIAEAERAVGMPLNDTQRSQVRALRQIAYSGRFSDRKSGYEGGYWGDEKLTPSLMPDFLRRDDLTDWLFTFQMQGAEAYLYSLNKFIAGGGDLWLMSALSKADKSSTQLPRLLEAANTANRLSAAHPTIAYHNARILLEQGKHAEARKLIDEMLALGDALPISAQNSFISLRLKLAETLEDFLKHSLKRAYAFDFDGHAGSVEDIIAEQKGYYNPEYNTEGREAYEAEIERSYERERLWQDRLMFDWDTIEVINQHFPTASLVEVMRSPSLPDYLRERFALAIWTRAFLLGDDASLNKVSAELVKYHPEFETLMTRVTAAKTPTARQNALLFFVLKNPILSPYVEADMGKTDNEAGQFESNDWWCEPYDSEYSDTAGELVPKGLPPRPAFLTSAQSQTAQNERKRLKEIGDAPKYLGPKVLAWAKRNPADTRVSEALYIMIEANGWTKYGCGNNEELQQQMIALLKKNYPRSEWVAKLAENQ